MENKPKLSVVAYDAQQEGFNAALEMNVRFLVRGIKPTDSSKYIDGILMAIQKLDIEKYHKPNIVKSEEDITCSGEQVEKNIRLDLSDISAGTIGKANVTGIDFHVPIMIDGVEVAKCVVDELSCIEFKETRRWGGI